MIIPEFENLKWRPLFGFLDCDVPGQVELGIPQRPWDLGGTGVGGHAISTAGIDESFTLREDAEITMRLRMLEHEFYNEFRPMWLVWCRQAQTFTVRLDANDPLTEYTMRLVAPWLEEGLRPSRHTFDGVLELDLTLCTADSAPILHAYYPQFAEDVS